MQRKVLTDESEPKTRRGIFDRSNPHRWADEIEAWASRTGWHVTLLYILVGVLLFRLALDLLAWGDYIVTGRY